MRNINDIANQLAGKMAQDLGLKKKVEPEISTRRTSLWDEDSTPVAPRANTSYAAGTKIWPSERFDLKTTASKVFPPKRPPVLISTYSDDDLEWMFSTPVKRGWEFKDWLETIGLPTDLHEKLDGAMYQYAARAYLNRKKEAHSR